ncbi:methylenetetrahydrofolate reductase [Pararhodobacter oceanensis]|uniref:Methylenetetrahydrofolate reductase n=1 Tax=Pararhodobacter oceanensis TaxID=2172121 RepID=A0A2T8HQ95_9RHOB|nr:methylenetetrahydrofolate reductase [Pararhodobacter oceanensis]PVH27593.1 5,10-methylenetetrahydrofolate reductase [Pararhodobacter oceanensis]
MSFSASDPTKPYAAPPEGFSSGSELERVLRAGKFAVTSELNPPDSVDPADVFEAAAPLAEVTDAINATDASGANCHMSSIGICAVLTRARIETVYQISCRDRNRIAMQGDVLGAAAMGVRNVLCLTGDGVGAGDQPGAKPVFDFDAISLIRTIRTMRDSGQFLSGRKITKPPHLFIGAAENPCVEPLDWRAQRLQKKVEAGAQFIQTNYVFDLPRFERFMTRVRDLGLDENVYILAGIGPLASAKAARWMRNNVPGIHIPDDIIARLEGADNQGDEGRKICVEFLQKFREIKGVSGVHIMAYRREHLVAEILREAGLTER